MGRESEPASSRPGGGEGAASVPTIGAAALGFSLSSDARRRDAGSCGESAGEASWDAAGESSDESTSGEEGSGGRGASVRSAAMMTAMLLDLRSKQARATVAMAHAAAVAAMQQPPPQSSKRGAAALDRTAAAALGDEEVETARAAAQVAQLDFETARLSVKLFLSGTSYGLAASPL